MSDPTSISTDASPEQRLPAYLALIPCLRILTSAERQRLADDARLVRLGRGERRGPEDGPLLLLSGRAALVRTDDDSDREKVSALLGPGSLCFEDRLFGGPFPPRRTVLLSNGDVLAARLSPEILAELGRDEPTLASALRSLASDGLRRFLEELATFSVPLDAATLRILLEGLRPTSFLDGDRLVTAGDPAAGFTVLGAGRARRESASAFQSPRLLAAGDFFGETALCLASPEPVTVTALTDGLLFRIAPREFERLSAGTTSLRTLLSTLVGALATQGHTAHPATPSDVEDDEDDEDTGALDAVDDDDDDEAFSRDVAAELATTGALRRLRGRFRFRRQLDSTDCGPACLGMVLDHYGKRASPSRLRDLCAVSRQGCSLYSIAEAAEALGVRSRGIEASFEDLSTVLLPAIAHVGTNHFVVVCEATPRHVVIADPATGIERVPRDAFRRLWKGFLLLLRPSVDVSSEEDEPRPGLRMFLPYLFPHRGVLAEVFLAVLVLQLLGLAVPLITQTVIDRVVMHSEVSILTALLFAAVGAALFTAVIGVLRRLLLFDAVRAADRALVTDFHHRLFHLPLRYFASRKVGDLLVRFSDNHDVRHFLTSVSFGAILDVCLGTIYLGVVFLYDARLAAVGILPIPFLLVLGLVVTPILRRNRRLLVQRKAEKQSALVEGLSAVAAVKSVRGETAERRRFEALFDQQLATELTGVRLTTISGALAGLVVAVGGALVLYVGAMRVVEGALTIGALVAVVALLGQVMAPAMRLVAVWVRFQETSVALERLADVLTSPPEEPAAGALLDLPEVEGHVRIDQVTFRYERDLEPALSDLSLEILPGEKVAIVGRSGAGKSTLAQLLLKLYEPESGAILLDGHDLRTVSSRSLREQVGLVPQKVDLLSGTISENIAFGRDLSAVDITSAARAAGAHEFIARRPYGYETVVGERGTERFSGGELQRLAIARTLAGKPRVLILDEPTSALDAATEAALLSSFEDAAGSGTLIVLAHRLAFTRRADRVIVLDQGRVAEQGTHAELVERGGLYASLYGEQAL